MTKPWKFYNTQPGNFDGAVWLGAMLLLLLLLFVSGGNPLFLGVLLLIMSPFALHLHRQENRETPVQHQTSPLPSHKRIIYDEGFDPFDEDTEIDPLVHRPEEDDYPGR